MSAPTTYIVILATLAASAAVHAQPQPAALPLSLEQALERGERESALLGRARAETRVERSRMVGANIALPANPFVSGGVGRRWESASSSGPGGTALSGTQYWLHLEQSIEIAGQRGTRRDVVARGIDLALARERLALAETRARVRSAYVGAQLARAQLDAAVRREALVKTLRDAAEIRARGGASSDVELNLAVLELGRAGRDRIGAALTAAESSAQLALLVGLPPGSRVELTTVLERPPILGGSLQELIDEAETRRAELAVLVATGSGLDAELRRLRREVIPNPTLFIELQRDLPGQVFVGGGLGMSLPMWRRNQGEQAVVRAERQRTEDERLIEQRRIAVEVERAYLAVRALLEQALLIETEMLPAADAAVDLVRQGWQAGKFDLFRVVQASRDAAEAKRTQLESLGELWQATIELDRATGK